MNITHVNGCAGGFGGSETHVLDLAEQQIKDGHNIHLIFGPQKSFDRTYARFNQVTKLDDLGTNECERLQFTGQLELTKAWHPKIGGRLWRRIYNMYVLAPIRTMKYYKQISKTNSDLVHVHSPDDLPFVLAACKLRGTPCIFTSHGHTVLHEPFRYQKRNILYNWMQKKSLENCDQVIFVSDYALQDVEKWHYPSHHLNAWPVVYLSPSIPNKIEDKDPDTEGIDYPIIIGIVGQLNDLKRTNTVLDAIKILQDKDKDKNVYYEFWGSGKDKIIEKYVALSKSLHLNRINWCGWTDNMIAAYDGMDICIVPTSSMEVFALSRLEAMRREVCTVSFNDAGGGEGIDNGYNACTVSPNPEALANVLESLIEMPRVRREIAHAGRLRSVSPPFRPEDMFESINHIYEEIVNA